MTLQNDKGSQMVHSLDFHAAIGPGGGADLSQVPPGQSKTFTFQVDTPGLFVYHCGSPMIAQHIANGMYGLILVEPSGGLPHVDHEYYLMQGEIYTQTAKGKAGLQQFSVENLMAENAQYYLFNGAVDSLTKEYPLHANEGESGADLFRQCWPERHRVRAHGWGNLHPRLPARRTNLASAQRNSDGECASGGSGNCRSQGQHARTIHIHGSCDSRMEKGDMAILQVNGPENTP